MSLLNSYGSPRVEYTVYNGMYSIYDKFISELYLIT
jgi:hypothetical protein